MSTSRPTSTWVRGRLAGRVMAFHVGALQVLDEQVGGGVRAQRQMHARKPARRAW